MSFDLELSDIKEICGNVTYNKAMDMYLRNKVRTMKANENSATVLSVTAIVESSYDVKNYKVTLLINNKNYKLYPNCSCEDFQEHKMCKHIGAVLIKLNREGIRGRGLNIQRSNEEELLDLYRNSFDKEAKGFHKEILNLEITLIIDEIGYSHKTNTYHMELKVGTSRYYVVKNIKEFIECMFKSGGSINFGKELQYVSSNYTFRKDDLEILNLVKEIYDLNLEVMNKVYTNKAVFFSGKRVFLTEGQLRKILTIKNNKTINIDYSEETLKDVEVVCGNMPISFYMFMNGDNLSIDMNGDTPKEIAEEAGVFYLNNKVYMLSEKEKDDFLPLYRAFKKTQDNTISFKKKYISDVANYLLPKLNKLSPLVMKDEKVKEIIKDETLKTEFYLDKEKEGISCEVKFNYGNKVFQHSPNDSTEKFEYESYNKYRNDFDYDEKASDVVIRNRLEERNILTRLNDLSFKVKGDLLIIDKDDELVEFMTHGVEELMTLGEVYYSEAFKGIKILNSKMFKSSIRLNDSDLLAFDFSIDGVTKEELKEVLMSIKKRRKFYKLKNGSILSFDNNEIDDINSIMNHFDISGANLSRGEVILPKYASLYINDKISEGSLRFINRSRSFKDLIDTIKDINSNEYIPPLGQRKMLRSYQVIGFKWFKTLSACGFGGILGDEMGLGKTFQAITFITSEKEEGNLSNKALIVCPTSLVYNWVMEFEKFSNELKVVAISGGKQEREDMIKCIKEYAVVITSYALIRRDIEFYNKQNFDLCIIDEAQYIKNPMSLNSQSVKEIKARNKFAMTGTPIENSLTELWSIFDFIMPGYLKTHGKFINDFERAIVRENDERALQELLKLIRPFILRRFKKDVALELPPKIEHKIVVDMTMEQKKLYYSYVESFKKEMEEEIKEKGFNKSRMKILSLITRLRQICCDPASFIKNYDGDTGKYIALYDILEEALENNRKVLVFSQFVTILENIRETLGKKGVKTMYLDGSVPAKERMDLVREFNEGMPSVFLISLKAGGTGLNLTSADMVIHFDPWWNPAVEDQAVDRAHRIGQKNTVEVIKLITRGTIEEKIYNIQEKKKEIIEQVLDGEEHDHLALSSMNQEELEELFRI